MRAANLLTLGLAALALGAAGCGSDDNGGGDSTSGGGAYGGTLTAAQTSTPTATTPASGRSAVALSATEFKFTPSAVKVRSGKSTFELRNDGGAPHALEIEGNGVEEKTPVIEAGQSASLAVNLKPGKYEMYCPVGNHRQMGMEGQVTVS
jgi:uncharacterized cupredoxin-like copper-binding protein